ncbi:amidohydrolase [Metaclostridioides mangenotii]|uniref:amidohydrolase n=1 Tax=Metaclostridioides mangenotii TaxID=1540 RepID=UPI00048574DB|nr:amidohydrolase [Clostridioides mangenotii]
MGEKKELFEQMSGHRRTLNKIPELGRNEFETSKYIKNHLDNLGVEYETVLETGVVGIIKGKNPKKTLAFRADIDALCSDEGPKHLCGHDGHTSILLGLIEYVKNNIESLNDNIVFIFQPAEEGPGGAEDIIKAGVFKKYNVDEVFGLHIYPEIPEGYVGLRPGYFLAQIGDLNIDITSKTGHGAMPQTSVDGIVIAGNFVNAIQSIVSRNLSPIDNAVLTIGCINGGSRRNIIAGNIRLEGTMRTFKPEVYNTMKERLRKIAAGFEVSYDCKINVEIIDDYGAVNNDKNLFNEFIEAVGKENIIELDPLMISEDFSYYQKEVPGLFFMLGAKNEEKGYVNSLHNINFNFDEKIFINAIETYKKLLKFKKSID